MAKRKRLGNYEKKIAEGRCQGEGTDYKPYINNQDIASQGRTTRHRGIKAERQLITLSDYETKCRRIFEFSQVIVQIKEQYAVDINETRVIADTLGIKHPADPQTKELVPVDFDFFLEVKQGDGETRWIARTFKQKDKLCDRRVIEKFEIAREWCRQNNISWGIITEDELDSTVCKNIEKVNAYYDIASVGFKKLRAKERRRLIEYFVGQVLACSEPIRDLCVELEEKFELEYGVGLGLFKYLVAHHILEINLTKELEVSDVVPVKLNRDAWIQYIKKSS